MVNKHVQSSEKLFRAPRPIERIHLCHHVLLEVRAGHTGQTPSEVIRTSALEKVLLRLSKKGSKEGGKSLRGASHQKVNAQELSSSLMASLAGVSQDPASPSPVHRSAGLAARPK